MADANKTGRKPNTQPNGLIPALIVEVFLAGSSIGAIQAPQEDLLSAKGNTLFHGRISRGWTLPGEAAEALAALSFTVNGVEAKRSEKGVYVTSPSIDTRTGKIRTGSGGELLVAHTAFVDVSASDENVTYMVNVIAKQLKAKAGVSQGFQLRVAGIPKAVGTPGPQVVGSVSGLLVV